jgi:WD40 repeat protein/energy-coupling factor transporter ATP-binding protein EcfA2
MMNEEKYFNPFPGLRSFEEEEEYLFFGREKQIDELLNKLSKTRFLAVVGASGSGKSSLVKSGLLPALHAGFLSGGVSGWSICTFRPGGDPISNLAEALFSEEILGPQEDSYISPSFIESILRRSDQGIGETIKQLSTTKQRNILIVVDQFEELFRFSKFEKTENKETRDSVTFINLLLAASKYKASPIYVVFTMRSDFLGDCTEFRGLPEAINEGQYLIPRMTREERKAAITGPIAVGGSSISQALLTRLLNDVGDNPDQLPILQHALMRTWDQWAKNNDPDSPIDLEHYEAIGTMSKALSLHAEEAYFEIGTEQEREICRKIFKSLTEKRDDGRGVRRPCMVKEISEMSGSSIQQVIKVVEIFRATGRSFLMPPVGVELKEDSVIDISHESLMRVWERLIGWVHEEIESAELYTRLAKAAALYQEGKSGIWRDPELLMAMNWRESQKPNAMWARRYDPSFERAMNFLDHSQSEKERELLGAEKKRKAALVRLRITLGVIAFALCLSVYFGIQSFIKEGIAVSATKAALESKKDAEQSAIYAGLSADTARHQKHVSDSLKLEADTAVGEAKQAKILAEKSYSAALMSAYQASVAAHQASVAAHRADSLKEEAQQEKNNALVAQSNAEKAEELTRRLRLLAEAKNIALKSTQLINEKGKDTLSLQMAFLAYALNKKMDGPEQNRIIYDAMKSQLTRYYTKLLRKRKDLKFQTGDYDIRAIKFINPSEFVIAGDDGTVKRCELAENTIDIDTIISSKRIPEGISAIDVSRGNKWIIAGSISGSLYLSDLFLNSPAMKLIQKGKGKCIFVKTVVGTDDKLNVVSVCEKEIYIIKMNPNGEVIGSSTVTSSGKSFQAADSYVEGKKLHLFFSEGENLNETIIDADGSYSEVKKREVDFQQSITAIGVSKSGNYLALGGISGGVSIYKNSSVKEIPVNQIKGHLSAAIIKLVFSDDDSRIVSGSLDHTVRLAFTLKGKDEEDFVFKEKDAWVRSLAICSERDCIVSVGQSGMIQVWPASIPTLLKELRSQELNKVKLYDNFLKIKNVEPGFEEELGKKLLMSISGSDKGKKDYKSFDDFWLDMQKKYLND